MVMCARVGVCLCDQIDVVMCVDDASLVNLTNAQRTCQLDDNGLGWSTI